MNPDDLDMTAFSYQKSSVMKADQWKEAEFRVSCTADVRNDGCQSKGEI
jgi:hypothetical protein